MWGGGEPGDCLSTFLTLQWGSDKQTSLVFSSLGFVCSLNDLLFRWVLKSNLINGLVFSTPFEMPGTVVLGILIGNHLNTQLKVSH